MQSLLAAALVLLLSPAPARAAGANAAADRAASLAARAQYREAAESYREALRAEPENGDLHLSLGLVYQALERFDEAIRAIERAAELLPRSPDPRYSLALLHEAQAVRARDENRPADRRGHLEAARRAWKDYLKLEKDPSKSGVARRHLSDIAAQLAR